MGCGSSEKKGRVGVPIRHVDAVLKREWEWCWMVARGRLASSPVASTPCRLYYAHELYDKCNDERESAK